MTDILISSVNNMTSYLKKFIDTFRPPPVEKQFTITFSSDTANGATNVSASPNNAGSAFQVVLSNPIAIPKDAKSAELAVSTFYGYWTIQNIKYNENDMFKFVINAGSVDAGIYEVQVPAGIYSLPSLSNAIYRQLFNKYPALPVSFNPITFASDESTQRVVIIFNQDGVQVDFTIANSMRYIMGFYGDTTSLQVFVPSENNQDTVPYNSFSVSGQSVYANQVANFNTILFLLANSPELGKNGIATNGNQYNTLSVNPILVKVGSQIVNQYVLPQPVDISYLIGQKLTNLSFQLTDQKNRPVNTGGETWSIVCTFKYYI